MQGSDFTSDMSSVFLALVGGFSGVALRQVILSLAQFPQHDSAVTALPFIHENDSLRIVDASICFVFFHSLYSCTQQQRLFKLDGKEKVTSSIGFGLGWALLLPTLASYGSNWKSQAFVWAGASNTPELHIIFVLTRISCDFAFVVKIHFPQGLLS